MPECSIDWNVKTGTVFQILRSSEQRKPSAYQFGSSRFSRCFCIMATMPEVVSESQRARMAQAKIKAAKREEIESAIPKHLLYVKGWPVAIPNLEEVPFVAETADARGSYGDQCSAHYGPVGFTKRYTVNSVEEEKARTRSRDAKQRRLPLCS